MVFTIPYPLALLALALLPVTRNTAVAWIKIALWSIWGLSKPALRRVGILPGTPTIWPVFYRVIQVSLGIYILLLLALGAGFWFKKPFWIDFGCIGLMLMGMTFISIWQWGKKWLSKIPKVGPKLGINPAELTLGMGLLALFPAILLVANTIAPKLLLSPAANFALKLALGLGIIVWVACGWAGLKPGKWTGRAALALVILSLTVGILAFTFPQDTRAMEAKKMGRDKSVGMTALVEEIKASKTTGKVTSEKTPVYEVDFDDEGTVVKEVRVAKDTDGNEWMALANKGFITTTPTAEDRVVVNGEVLIPVLFPDNNGKYVLSKGVKYLLAEDTALTREAVTPVQNGSPTPAPQADLAPAAARNIGMCPGASKLEGEKFTLVPDCTNGYTLVVPTRTTKKLSLVSNTIDPFPQAGPVFKERVRKGGLMGIDYWANHPNERQDSWDKCLVVPGQLRFGVNAFVGNQVRTFAQGQTEMAFENNTDTPLQVRVVYNGAKPTYGSQTGTAVFTWK